MFVVKCLNIVIKLLYYLSILQDICLPTLLLQRARPEPQTACYMVYIVEN